MNDILTQIGLEAREITIYLALLELGETTVLPLAQKANIKRTYCYDILEVLVKKGLVTFIIRHGRRRYSAEDPSKIETMLKDRLEAFSRTLPELRSIYNQAGKKPVVRYYEGKEVAVQVARELAKVRSYDAITSPDHVIKAIGKQAEALGQQIQKNKIKVRELYIRGGLPIVWAKYYQKPLQEYRFLPAGIKCPTDFILYENKLALIAYGEMTHGLIIEGSEIVSAHRIMFDLLWQATPAIG